GGAGEGEERGRAWGRERAEGRIRELESESQQRQLADLKREVALEQQLPESLAPRLQGDDRRSLKADAQRLSDDLQAGRPEGDLGIGRGAGAAGQSGRVDMNQIIREAERLSKRFSERSQSGSPARPNQRSSASGGTVRRARMVRRRARSSARWRHSQP